MQVQVGVERDVYTMEYKTGPEFNVVSPKASNYIPPTDQTITNIIRTQQQNKCKKPIWLLLLFSVILGFIMTLRMHTVTNLFHFSPKETVINVTDDHNDHRCQTIFR